MLYLPLPEVPERLLWESFRAPYTKKVRSAEGATLRSLIMQVLVAKKGLRASQWEEILGQREIAHLAYKAVREEGLEPAIQHLPKLMETFGQAADDPALRAQLRTLIEAHGESSLKDCLGQHRSLWSQDGWDRLCKLLAVLRINLEPRRLMVDPYLCINKMTAEVFDLKEPRTQQNGYNRTYISVWDAGPGDAGAG